MTIVVYELTCPHDRREILIVIEITINVSFFFSPSWKRWRASNSPSVVRASSVLVILYHAGTFHASKRRKMTKWKLAVFRGILVVDTRYKELSEIFDIHILYSKSLYDLYLRFDSNWIPLFRSGYNHVGSMYATGVFDPRETPVE